MLELYGLKINVFENVYEPAEDTFLLISALQNSDLKNKTVLEIGTGSGIIALFAARFAKSVLAVDINPKAINCAKENVKINGIKNVEFRESNLFSNINEKFDIIIFNPPYLPDEQITQDIALDGGHDGRKVIERFLEDAPKFLNARGKIFLLESSISHYEKTLQHFEKIGFNAIIIAREKFDWEELVVMKATHI
ncbi:MAG: HemK2/MTQ2 family protein methyltransferase [Nanoarchaeota archaeon]|nr:methyltransferase [Nanoarchaeota archaeon]MBU4300553.1 methyltransferase [Nanoarchaeota archaeon]MBU4451327.1 methyltransferase [Nanoarchaeota archaeon]MCG2723288.1 class I SAM-dependent methyltransferase [archaeon]